MSSFSISSPTRRAAKVWAAIVTSIALIFGSALGAAPVYAAPSAGYDGVQSGGIKWWETHLAPMTVGEKYADSVGLPFVSLASVKSTRIPAGLHALWDGYAVKITGTPSAAGNLNLKITADLVDGRSAVLTFSGKIAPAKTKTTTAVTSAGFMPYSELVLSATVEGADKSIPTGTVQFMIGKTLFGEPASVDADGVASVAGIVDGSLVGEQEVSASYSGHGNYLASMATQDIAVHGAQLSGTVFANDVVQAGVTVTLVPTEDSSEFSLTTTTDDDGAYSFTPAIDSLEDAMREYELRATFAGDVGIILPDTTSPLSWDGTAVDIARSVAPVWTDSTLATPRQASAYSDSVVASGGTISYSVSSGQLPSGLTLNETTGAITGTPECGSLARGVLDPCAYSFDITADNTFATVTHTFEGVLLDAGVVPTLPDEALTELDLQLTVPFSGSVAVEGDPTITYAVTEGSLPKGLKLDASSGAITGTPECTVDSCDYSFTVTASNDYGSVEQKFTGTIAAAPELALVLNFTAGTELSEASSTISASGLKVGSEYTLVMHSDPVTLYTGKIGASGAFTWDVALQAGAPTGAHKLILTGVSPDGSTLTSEAWFTLLADGVIGATSSAGPASLPEAADNADLGNTIGETVDVPVLDNGTGDFDTATLRILDGKTPVTTLVVAGQGTWSVVDGLIRFTPETGFLGDATPVGYQVTDVTGGVVSALVTVAYVPEAIDDASHGNTIGEPVTVDVLGSDIGDVDPSSVKLIDPSTGSRAMTLTVNGQGTWSVNAPTGAITFAPEAGYFGNPTAVEYEITDSTGDSVTASVIVSYLPEAADDIKVGNEEGSAVTVDVIGNDIGDFDATSVQLIDPITKALTITLKVDGEGTWTVDPKTGSVTFTPEAGFDGDPTAISYQVTDMSGNGTTAEVTVAYEHPAPAGLVPADSTPADLASTGVNLAAPVAGGLLVLLLGGALLVLARRRIVRN